MSLLSLSLARSLTSNLPDLMTLHPCSSPFPHPSHAASHALNSTKKAERTAAKKMLRVPLPYNARKRSSTHLQPHHRRQLLVPSSSSPPAPTETSVLPSFSAEGSAASYEQERASLLSAASVATTNPQATAVGDPRFFSVNAEEG